MPSRLPQTLQLSEVGEPLRFVEHRKRTPFVNGWSEPSAECLDSLTVTGCRGGAAAIDD